MIRMSDARQWLRIAKPAVEKTISYRDTAAYMRAYYKRPGVKEKIAARGRRYRRDLKLRKKGLMTEAERKTVLALADAIEQDGLSETAVERKEDAVYDAMYKLGLAMVSHTPSRPYAAFADVLRAWVETH